MVSGVSVVLWKLLKVVFKIGKSVVEAVKECSVVSDVSEVSEVSEVSVVNIVVIVVVVVDIVDCGRGGGWEKKQHLACWPNKIQIEKLY